MRIAHHNRALVIVIKSVPKYNLPFNRSISRNPSLTKNRTPKSMASEGTPISETTDTVDDVNDDVKYGFRRPEMYQNSLADSVGAYGRHVFLCYKTSDAWPPRIETSDADPLPKLFASALKSRKNDIAVKTNLTICEGREGTEFSDGDVLVFPEMIKYRSLKESDVDSFVKDVVVNGNLWEFGEPEAIYGSFVFVCAHNSRDRRCGVCGPALIEKFNEEIGSRGIHNKVTVSACSHIGGHKYAGNLIIYSTGPDGKIMGNWYGYVTPDDVPELLDQHIAKGEIIQRLWRGQMGLITEDVEKAKEEKLPNGDKESDNNKQQESTTSQEDNNKESFTSCCQGSNGGFTCCIDGSSEVNGEVGEKSLEACSEGGGQSVCKLKNWVGSLEQKDILAVAAVVGAIGTVAVAYSYYRRSR